MNKNEKWEKDMAKKNAARELLKSYIASHPQDVMFAVENLVPFFCDCSYDHSTYHERSAYIQISSHKFIDFSRSLHYNYSSIQNDIEKENHYEY